MMLPSKKITAESADQVELGDLKVLGDLLMRTFDGQARITEITRYVDAMTALDGDPSADNLAYAQEALDELRRYVDLLTRTTMSALSDQVTKSN